MKKLIITILCVTTLCGCGGREIDDMAYVVAIGVDTGENELYEFTFAIGNPDSINGGGGEESGGSGSDALIIENQSGANIFTAGNSVSARIGQEINFSHAELLVFSESVAANGVADFLDALTRNLNQRPKLVPAVAEVTAGEALSAVNSKFEGNPEKFLKKIFESKASPVSSGIDSRTFLCRTKNADVGTAVSRISVGDEISVNAMAVFDGEYMAGAFDDVLAYKFLTGRIDDISYDAAQSGSLMLTQRVKPKISVNCGTVPMIDVKIELDATVASLGKDVSKEQLYSAVEASIEDRLLSLANYSKDIGVDIFGFDRYGRKCFLIWDRWQSYNWKEKYKNAQFNIDVDIKPEKTGLIKGGL